MEISLGDIVKLDGKQLMVVYDSLADTYPYLLIDLEKYEVFNSYWTIEDIIKIYFDQ